MKIRTERVVHDEVELTNDEAKSVTLLYLEEVVIGKGCCVTKAGRLEHWTSYPHGSGTTEDRGVASELQVAADTLHRLLRRGLKCQ